MGTTVGRPRPYESGSAEAEYHESVTGETAEAYGQTNVVPVLVTDPVRVEDFPARRITTDQLGITSVAQRVLSSLRTRTKVTLRASADLFIGGEGVTVGTGFLIPAGQAVTIEATGSLYAVAAAPATLYVLAEHRDG